MLNNSLSDSNAPMQESVPKTRSVISLSSDFLDPEDERQGAELQQIWEELAKNSVEVAAAFGCNTLWDFAAHHCLFIQTIIQAERFETAEQGLAWSPSRLAGLIYMTESSIHGEVNLGLVLLPWARKNGWAQTAGSLALRWAFEEAGYHRVQAAIIAGPHRPATMRLFARMSFSHEGVKRRQVYSQVFLEYKDVTYMGIVDTEYMICRYRPDIPRSPWDELLQRHQKEREELLDLEAARAPLKRSASTETIKWMQDKEGEGEERQEKPSTFSRGATPGSQTLGDYYSSYELSGSSAASSTSGWQSIRRHDARAVESDSDGEWLNDYLRTERSPEAAESSDNEYLHSAEEALAEMDSDVEHSEGENYDCLEEAASPGRAPSPPESQSSKADSWVIDDGEEETPLLKDVPSVQGGGTLGPSSEGIPSGSVDQLTAWANAPLFVFKRDTQFQ
ncbi:hypothetical protein M422DRAFT_33840 [Sphaerobolus stellatus SS14]|uniref:Uncharacterized protein n=1 Tax=Sphaerobolus stellatus (strain SS14) TaxID=990650 RepID=A0A0C9URA3_SPHS4|nr:hypothetical protein M422DRAFT_33840 [Sphaerobolus stellatus SS14]